MAACLDGSSVLQDDATKSVIIDIPSPMEWCMRSTMVEVALEVGKSSK
jgi:hypothetical protein